MSFGSSSFGGAPFGGGVTFAAYGTGTTPATREGLTAAKVRQVSGGDYVRSSTSTRNNLAAAPDPIAQEVAFRVGTELGTLAGAPTFGNDAIHVLVFTDSSAAEIEHRVRVALEPMVDRGTLEQVHVVPEPYTSNGRAFNAFRVTYTPTQKVEV